MPRQAGVGEGRELSVSEPTGPAREASLNSTLKHRLCVGQLMKARPEAVGDLLGTPRAQAATRQLCTCRRQDPAANSEDGL